MQYSYCSAANISHNEEEECPNPLLQPILLKTGQQNKDYLWHSYNSYSEDHDSTSKIVEHSTEVLRKIFSFKIW